MSYIADILLEFFCILFPSVLGGTIDLAQRLYHRWRWGSSDIYVSEEDAESGN